MSFIQMIRVVAVIFLFSNIRCQDGYGNQNILRLQQLANNGPIESIASFNSNPNSQSFTALNVQYSLQDENKYDDYNRAERGRPKKTYRIKNPFSQQEDENNENLSQDSGTSEINQFMGVQYSLPPEDFLKQMRTENQYHQQQQSQQLPTPNPSFAYTATPQPQFMYSTASGSHDNQPSHQPPQQESRSYNSGYNSNSNAYQFNNVNSYNADVVNSTPLPSYLSTQANQFIGTPTNTYASSASPMYMTNSPNLQPYVSSPYSQTQTGTIDYNNRVSTLISSLQHYDNNAINNKKQSDQYDLTSNSRYSTNVPNQYQNIYPSSTISPISSPYSDDIRDNWQDSSLNFNSGANALPKSSQDLALSSYSSNFNFYGADNQDNRKELRNDGFNKESQYNQLYYNYGKSDNQQSNNIKRDFDQQTGQTALYSHGDYGWKLYDQKPSHSAEISTVGHLGYQTHSSNTDNSQLSIQMDTIRPYSNHQISKSSSEKLEGEEFARAAAKAHENYKQQLEVNRILANQYSNNNNALSSLSLQNQYFSNNEKQRKIYDNSNANSYPNGNIQSDLATSSPYYYMNMRDSALDKNLNSFDHDRAIKNTVPMAEVSSAIPNVNSHNSKSLGFDATDKYSFIVYNKDQNEQTKQFNRPTSDSYYKDNSNMYPFNIKPENTQSLTEKLKQTYQGNSQSLASNEFTNYINNKRFIEDLQQSKESANQLQNYVNGNSGVGGNGPLQNFPRNLPTQDASNFINFGDIPSRLTHNLNPDTFRTQNINMEHGGLPNPLPARINQNVETHHMDVSSELLHKLLANKHRSPDTDVKMSNLFSTINGFKVANPFNVDIRLVEEMLKGQSTRDDRQINPAQESFSKLLPMKLDVSELKQLLLKNDNNGVGLNGLSSASNPFFDFYSSNRFPYQGVKYSRSAEEPENIPITDTFIVPVVAVEDDDSTPDRLKESSNTDISETDSEDSNSDKSHSYNRHLRTMADRYLRNSYLRKYLKRGIDGHPTLKHLQVHKTRSNAITDKHARRRRLNRNKITKLIKSNPIYETKRDFEDAKRSVSILLKPPPVSEDRMDVVEEEKITE